MSSSLKQLVNQAIQNSPSADNSQPWHVSWDKNSLSLSYDTPRVGEQTFPADSPAILLAIGAVIENIKQITLAVNTELDITLAPNFSLNNPHYFIASFQNQALEKEYEINNLAVFNRHTNRLGYSSERLTDDIIDMLKNLTLGHAKVKCFSETQDITQLAFLVRKASEIRFKTKEINEWLGRSLRFGKQAEERKDGLDIATLDLPPGGGLFLRLISNWNRMRIFNLFGAYLTMSFIDSAPVKKAPALIAITAPSSTQGIIDAGQLMEKLWISLNEQGIAVHPYYVICDQLHRRKAGIIPKGLEQKADKIYAKTNALFQFDEGDELQMLLRVGHPKKTVKRSQRLDLDKICSNL